MQLETMNRGTSESKRLLIFIHSLRGGGAGRVCTFVANGLSRRGWKVEVAVSLPDEQRWLEDFDSEVLIRQLKTRHARRSFFALMREVKAFTPDVVLAFNYQLAVLLPFVRFASGITFRAVGRTVVALSEAARYRGFWQREIVMPVVRRLYRHLDLVIAQAEAMRRDLVEQFSLRSEQVVVINNPAISSTSYDHREPFSKTDSGEAALLFLGRFKDQKQPLLLLELLDKLRRRDGFTGLRLIAAGEGPLVDEFLAEVERRGLSSAVDYRGFSGDIDSLFSESDVTVLTSRYEGFPNTLVESIARGVPVVSFDCPSGPSDIIDEGKNGFLIPQDDIDAMVDATADLLEDPPSKSEVLETSKKFDPDSILDRYEKVLNGSHI